MRTYEQLEMFGKYRATCPICGCKFYAVKQKPRQIFCDWKCRQIAEVARDYVKTTSPR